MSNLFQELRRRNVFRVGAAYLLVAWLVVQVVDTLGDLFAIPEAFGRGVVILLAIAFPIALIVSWVYEVTPGGIATQEAVDAGAKTTSGRKLNVVIVGGIAVAIMFLVTDNYLIDRTASGPDESPSAPLTPEVNVESSAAESYLETLADTLGRDMDNENSIAVLPFRDLSPNADQGWFADGISEEISNLLTRIDELEVINTNSSFNFRNQENNFQDIREQLDVNYLLTGSIRRAGDDFRIGVQLTNTLDGTQRWSDNFEGTLDDIFDVQDAIAADVAQALEITLGVGEIGSNPGMTRNPRAYELYLEAQELDGFSFEAFSQRIALLERAIELDADFIAAYDALISNFMISNAYLNDAFPDRIERVQEAVDQIRTRMPDHPGSLRMTFQPQSSAGDWLGAERGLQEVAEQIAGYAYSGGLDIPQVIIQLLQAVGRINDAALMAERLRAKDPLNEFYYWALAEARFKQGDYDRAFALNEQGLALNPDYPNLVGQRILLILAERDQEKLQALAAQDYDPATSGINYPGLTNLFDPEAGIAGIQERLAEGLPMIWHLVAADWLSYFGASEAALATLQEAVDTGYNKMAIAFDIFRPFHAELRRLPEFKNLVRDLGLVGYWRATGDWGDFCRPLEGSDDFECF